MAKRQPEGLYFLLISTHGLIRGEQLELGRDADTGGQTKYVVELARALAEHPRVSRVDLVTRQVFSKKVDPIYSQPVEQIAERAYIIRIPFGPKRYLKKEKLWPYLASFSDQLLHHIRVVGRAPDIIHGHYADAGYAGSRLARLLGVPFVFTGHSLGRVKQARLMEKGQKKEALEQKYNFRQRFEAEELALNTASFVVVSTQQEIEEQYAMYDYYEPSRMEVIAPGVDLSRFSPPSENTSLPDISTEVFRFLRNPEKPMILAVARPDERKNFPTLLHAYGSHQELRKLANLVIVAGNRDRIAALSPRSRRVFRIILSLIDDYDLYGSISYPKHHGADDVPELFRLAAKTKGVFVNPALTEPFGLTLIEAAASGLPVVATNDGGPQDILKTCKNGKLIDPRNSKEIASTIYQIIKSPKKWQSYSVNGITRSHRHYSWASHVERYLQVVNGVLRGSRPGFQPRDVQLSRLPTIDRILVTSIDDTLTGDLAGTKRFVSLLKKAGDHIGFGVTTGRGAKQTVELLRELEVPMPDILIASVGTEIYYGKRLIPDISWHRHINHDWNREAVFKAMRQLKGLRPQPESEQQEFKVSFVVSKKTAPTRRQIQRHLRQLGLQAHVVFSLGMFIDVLPLRASTGLAIRYLTFKWGVPPERLLVAGYAAGEASMLIGNTLGVVVAEHSPELKSLRGRPRVYFAQKKYARGLIEGIKHYDFFKTIRIPKEED